MDNRNYSAQEVKDALEHASNATPRVYEVTGIDLENINFAFFGCQGSNGPYATNVANLINEIAKNNPNLLPTALFALGDNFYPDGVDRPTDPRFEKNFHEPYGSKERPEISDIPVCVLLGNHDEGRDAYTPAKSYIPSFAAGLLGTNPLRFSKAALQQFAHSYLPHPSDPVNTPKHKLFTQDQIPHKSLPKHIMPHPFYSIIFGSVQIFMLNSNTYVNDYLELIKSKAYKLEIDKNNQAAWLKRELKKAKPKNQKEQRKMTIIGMHHPIFTAGKRKYPKKWDANHYLEPLQITLWNQISKLDPNDKLFYEKCYDIFENINNEPLISNANYNEMLGTIFDFQNLLPYSDLFCAAHDHSLYYYNNKNDALAKRKICQVVAGTGGSNELQARRYFGEQQNIGCFRRHYGFVMINYNRNTPGLFNIHAFFTDGLKLKFNTLSKNALCAKNSDVEFNYLRDAIIKGCEQYMNFLHIKQEEANGRFYDVIPNSFFSHNVTHVEEDVDLMNDMMTFVNQPEPMDFKRAVPFIYNKMNDIKNKTSDHSLYIFINKCIKDFLNDYTIEMLYEKFRRPSRHYFQYSPSASLNDF